MKIYHNPRCSKSRCAVQWLKDNSYSFELVDYMKKNVSRTDLGEILSKLNMNAIDLMRKNEIEFKELVSGQNLSEEELIDLMVKFPKLIERPIVLWDNLGVVARPFEKLTDLLNIKLK